VKSYFVRVVWGSRLALALNNELKTWECWESSINQRILSSVDENFDPIEKRMLLRPLVSSIHAAAL
jgi:hypothetical protein